MFQKLTEPKVRVTPAPRVAPAKTTMEAPQLRAPPGPLALMALTVRLLRKQAERGGGMKPPPLFATQSLTRAKVRPKRKKTPTPFHREPLEEGGVTLPPQRKRMT